MWPERLLTFFDESIDWCSLGDSRACRPICYEGKPASGKLENFRLRLIILIFSCTLSACGPAETAATGAEAFKAGRYGEAAKLWKSAARSGDPVAQFKLGRLYEHGTGVKQSYEAAAIYYQEAARTNQPYAQGSLGVLYAYGLGVPQDFMQSYIWSTLAATNYPAWAKDERAAAIRNRDIVSARMSAQELIKAQRAIEEIRAR